MYREVWGLWQAKVARFVSVRCLGCAQLGRLGCCSDAFHAQLARPKWPRNNAGFNISRFPFPFQSLFNNTLPVLPFSAALFPLLLFVAFLSKMISILFSRTSLPSDSSPSK